MSTAFAALWVRCTTMLGGRGDRGASLVEYALLAALIAIVCLTAVFFLGGETSKEFDSIGSSVREAT